MISIAELIHEQADEVWSRGGVISEVLIPAGYLAGYMRELQSVYTSFPHVLPRVDSPHSFNTRHGAITVLQDFQLQDDRIFFIGSLKSSTYSDRFQYGLQPETPSMHRKRICIDTLASAAKGISLKHHYEREKRASFDLVDWGKEHRKRTDDLVDAMSYFDPPKDKPVKKTKVSDEIDFYGEIMAHELSLMPGVATVVWDIKEHQEDAEGENNGQIT